MRLFTSVFTPIDCQPAIYVTMQETCDAQLEAYGRYELAVKCFIKQALLEKLNKKLHSLVSRWLLNFGARL